MESGALGRRRRRGGTAFNPLTLFANSEAGAWYDPSDLTAEKVAWRRNLLTWSEDFTNAAWNKLNITVTANAIAAPDGTLTADKLEATATAATNNTQTATATSSQATYSFYGKQGSGATDCNRFILRNNTTAVNLSIFTVDWSTGAVSLTGSGTATSENVGSGWWRIVLSVGTGITQGNQLQVYTAFTGNSETAGEFSYIWGVQLEAGLTATAYQRITNFTSDFLAAFPTHALYQDSGSTTPVTALGQPVGLVYDTSRGSTLGPELLADPSFDNAGAWEKSAGVTISGGQAVWNTASASEYVRQPSIIAANVYYEFTIVCSSYTSGSVVVGIGAGGSNLTTFPVSAVGTVRFRANTGAFSGRAWLITPIGGAQLTIDSFSVREVPGVHAIQPTSASRPLLDGRVNLLTFSEQFDNAAWNKGTGGSISANSVMAPDGTMTADAYTWATSTLQFGFLSQSVSGAPQVAHQYTIYLKVPAGIGSKQLRLRMSDVTISTADSSNVTVTESWQAFTFTRTSANATGQVGVALNVASGGPANGIAAGDVLHVWGADLRLATDAAYPYQRVAAATDYADVGVPRSFAFDGFDDSLYTASNMDLSGTDKVTVLTGVRKLSDAAAGIFAETGANAASVNGTFFVAAPVASGSQNYSLYVRGTALNADSVYTNAAVAAPNTSVVTGLANIAGPSTVLRVNGTQVAGGSSALGTGNLASQVLFIGRRNNASLPLNGKAYQFIVRGAFTDNALLAQAEVFVAQKTGLSVTPTFPTPVVITGNQLDFSAAVNSGHIATIGL